MCFGSVFSLRPLGFVWEGFRVKGLLKASVDLVEWVCGGCWVGLKFDEGQASFSSQARVSSELVGSRPQLQSRSLEVARLASSLIYHTKKPTERQTPPQSEVFPSGHGTKASPLVSKANEPLQKEERANSFLPQNDV